MWAVGWLPLYAAVHRMELSRCQPGYFWWGDGKKGSEETGEQVSRRRSNPGKKIRSLESTDLGVVLMDMTRTRSRSRSRRRYYEITVLVSLLLTASDAFFLPHLRLLATAAPPSSLLNVTAPAPSPDPSKNGSDGNVTGKAPGEKGMGSNVTGNKPDQVGPAPSQSTANHGGDKVKKRGNSGGEPKKGVKAGPGDNCTGIAHVCDDPSSGLIACFLNPQPGSKEMAILVENNGEAILRVNLTAPSSNDSAVLQIQKHKKQKVFLVVDNGSTTVDCELSTVPLTISPGKPASSGNPFFRLPSTDKLITPVNGAYFLILAVLVFGGVCACFMLRRKGRHDGIPYQELEMSVPESSPRINTDAAEGWDEDWDDDWDEENAVTPGARHAGSISANGLTSRSANKDSWDRSWDD